MVTLKVETMFLFSLVRTLCLPDRERMSCLAIISLYMRTKNVGYHKLYICFPWAYLSWYSESIACRPKSYESFSLLCSVITLK